MTRRNAFTLVELLVSIAIIGLLVAILLPAINSVRSSARSVTCKNKLRQLAFATINYESANDHFPPARIQPRPGDGIEQQCGGNGISWVIHVLPYVEEVNFGGKWDVYKDFGFHDPEVRQTPLSILLCPERRTLRDAVSASNAEPTKGDDRLRKLESDQPFYARGCG